jgi:hypothetical protein
MLNNLFISVNSVRWLHYENHQRHSLCAIRLAERRFVSPHERGKIMKFKFIMNIILVLFLLSQESCKVQSPESLRPKYIGKWELAKIIYYPSRIDTISTKQFLTLNSDLSFNSTTSLFWRSDSLSSFPLSGTWDVAAYQSEIQYSDVYMYFTVDTVKKTFNVSGSVGEGYLDLNYGSENGNTYEWFLVK